VFARIEPTQKELIVDVLMKNGHFVAVTGDGVNDAPAMRRANAGVAMGRNGTDVAREVADLIITDDNFASIVDGIEQGRIVYNNIRKVIALLIATGFSALLLFFLTVLAGLPMPMIAVQLLWLNLIANGLQDVALAFEPKEGGELLRQPRKPAEPIFERGIIEHVLVTGSVMGVLAFATFAWLMEQGTSVEEARNLVLILMILFGNIHALSSRSEDKSLFRMRFFANPFLIIAVPVAQLVHIGATYTSWPGEVLQLNPISAQQWLSLLAVALLLLLAEELHKYSIRIRKRNI
jgi:magnesium-transporting ATPase (P-type)